MRLSLHHWRLELGAVVGRQRRRHVLRHGWMFGGGAQQQQERCLSSSPSSTASMTSIRLYRILLRQLQSLPTMDHSSLLLQPPLNPRDYGRARIVNLYPNSSSAHNMEEDDNNNNKQSLLHLFSRWQTLHNKGNDDPKSERILQSWYRTVTGDDNWIPTSPEDDDDDDVEDVEEEPSLSVWTTHRQLHEVIRFAFDSSKQLNDPELLVGYQRLAIVAIRSLQDQEFLHYRTSVSTNDQHGVRVVATSSCIGTASTRTLDTTETKHRFAYRIRVENLPSTSSSSLSPYQDMNDTSAVQLLGRTWQIQEETLDGEALGEPILVNAPTTGAVGHLPVLREGQVFEYMSGCELSHPTGCMSGLLHMARVNPSTTQSAVVGDPVEAFDYPQFQVVVQPFSLLVEDDQPPNNNKAQ